MIPVRQTCFSFEGCEAPAVINGNMNSTVNYFILSAQLVPYMAANYPQGEDKYHEENALFHKSAVERNYLEDQSFTTV